MGIVHCMSLMVAIVGCSGMPYPDRLYENDKTGKRCRLLTDKIDKSVVISRFYRDFSQHSPRGPLRSRPRHSCAARMSSATIQRQNHKMQHRH